MSRNSIQINAGSMADIAFLLLIFFLVTTTMDVDIGITRKLPPMPQGKPPEIQGRNILKVLVNHNDRLMVNNQECTLFELKSKVIGFITNPNNNPDLSAKKTKLIKSLGYVTVSKGIISLKSDRSTSYKQYIAVQNELASAFRSIRNDFATRHYGISFDDLRDENKKDAVKNAIPLAISEAEPENISNPE